MSRGRHGKRKERRLVRELKHGGQAASRERRRRREELGARDRRT